MISGENPVGRYKAVDALSLTDALKSIVRMNAKQESGTRSQKNRDGTDGVIRYVGGVTDY